MADHPQADGGIEDRSQTPLNPAADALGILDLFRARARRYGISSTVLKVVGGVATLAAGIAAAVRLAFPALNIDLILSVALCGATVTFFCAVLNAIIDKDSNSELMRAFHVTEDYRAAKTNYERALQQIRSSSTLEEERKRAQNLFLASDLMSQAALQYVKDKSGRSPEALAETVIALAGFHLTVASGFTIGSNYTICIYKAIEIDGKKHLSLVADKREIECKRADGRVWPCTAKSVGGRAFLVRDSAIEPNLPEWYAQQGGDPKMHRPTDDARYKSIAAFAIMPDGNPEAEPWGVVVGTSNVLGHYDHGQPPVSPVGAIRLIAQLMGQALYAP